MANSTARPANLHDVARLAGVSYQTVSRVINQHPYVSTNTRDKVLVAIQELDYHPNRAARALITGRSQALQIISSDLTFYQPIPSMINTAHRHGYQIGVSPIDSNLNHAGLRQYVNQLKSRQTDGVIILSPYSSFDHEELEQQLTGVIPYVHSGGVPGADTPAVWIDQRHGARLAVQHLLDLGHCRIAEISGLAAGDLFNHDARLRHESIQAMLAENNLDLVAWEQAAFFPAQGYECVEKMLRKQTPFSALLCGNDDLAIGAIAALIHHGLRVPEDVSVIGYDNVMIAAFTRPPLTTVAQDIISLGDLSVEHLISLIEQPEQPAYQRVIYPQLVVRQSTTRPG